MQKLVQTVSYLPTFLSVVIVCSLAIDIMIMLIMRTGQVFRVGAEKVLLLYTRLTHEVADVFGTYVYRAGIKDTI